MHRGILVADDVADAADSLADVFRMQGHVVETAYDGDEAYQKAIAFRPTIMVIDLAMPALNGCDLARRIRRDPELQDICLIAYTGYADQAHRDMAEKAGFDHCLVKPVHPERFQTIFDRVWANSDKEMCWSV
jgi:two-component system, chemotaxis family, CheB/CheR fusion protein